MKVQSSAANAKKWTTTHKDLIDLLSGGKDTKLLKDCEVITELEAALTKYYTENVSHHEAKDNTLELQKLVDRCKAFEN